MPSPFEMRFSNVGKLLYPCFSTQINYLIQYHLLKISKSSYVRYRSLWIGMGYNVSYVILCHVHLILRLRNIKSFFF